mgnify:FL=1
MRFVLKHIKLLTWLYLLLLVLLSVLPINSGVTLNNTYVVELRLDYMIHALVLLPLPVLLTLSLGGKPGCWIWVISFSLLIVVFTEGIQMVLPYRTFNINDLLANGAGALVGLIPAVFVKRRMSAYIW